MRDYGRAEADRVDVLVGNVCLQTDLAGLGDVRDGGGRRDELAGADVALGDRAGKRSLDVSVLVYCGGGQRRGLGLTSDRRFGLDVSSRARQRGFGRLGPLLGCGEHRSLGGYVGFGGVNVGLGLLQRGLLVAELGLGGDGLRFLRIVFLGGY